MQGFKNKNPQMKRRNNIYHEHGLRVHFSTVMKTVISPDTVISHDKITMTVSGEMTLFLTAENWTQIQKCIKLSVLVGVQK